MKWALYSAAARSTRSQRPKLSCDRSRADWRSLHSLRWHTSGWARRDLAIDPRSYFSLSLRAISADMSSLTAPVARLASLVERSTVRGRAVPGDVSKLAASIALHGLSLAVASKVVRAAALVACRCAVVAGEATTISASVASSWCTSSTSRRCGIGIRTVALHAR